jgi:hypothetical protein
VLTVGELVQTPHLGLTVIAASAGLDRRVLWSHVSEMEDTADWLDGEELLMTMGLGIPEGAAGQLGSTTASTCSASRPSGRASSAGRSSSSRSASMRSADAGDR